MVGGLAGNIDTNMRILRNKCFQVRQQAVPAESCADADGKVPKSHITKAGEFRFSCFKRVESVRYMMKKAAALLLSEKHHGGTFEEVCLKFVFKTADGFADGRLTNVEPSGSSGDGAALGNSIKNAV